MKCPHCDYQAVWSFHAVEPALEAPGAFYTLPISLVKQDSSFPRSVRNVYGCPSCNKVFMDF